MKLLYVYVVILLSLVKLSFTTKNYLCHSTSKLRGRQPPGDVVVIGDIHGEFDGLLEILSQAGVVEKGRCAWKESAKYLTLIQTGDIVDRGKKSINVSQCLDYLSSSLPPTNLFVRLLGNHDLWWLEGDHHMKNKKFDTDSHIATVRSSLYHGVLSRNILGAYVLTFNSLKILFTHSGLRKAMMTWIWNQLKITDIGPHEMENYINKEVFDIVSNCQLSPPTCHFRSPLFDAGPDRHGQGLGGPFWTDYSVIQKESPSLNWPWNPSRDWNSSIPFIQIVGHTPAQGDSWKIRSSANLASICVDVGMVFGGRGYLHLDSQSHFWAWEKTQGLWKSRDLLQTLDCD